MRTGSNVMEEISQFNTQQDDSKKQYLTFILAGEEYGVDILRVQEIRGWDNVTKIPNAPPYIKGVMNLRGVIVPILDLRTRFGLGELEYGATTVVIVLKVETDNKQRTMGIVADAVSDVYDIENEFIKPPPDFGGVINVEFITGMATVGDKMVIVLNVSHLLTFSEMETLDSSVMPERADNKNASGPLPDAQNA